MSKRSSGHLGGSGIVTDRAAVYGHYQVDAVGWDFYDRVCRTAGFPESIPPKLLGHFAGETGDGWEVLDFWTSAQAMESLFTNVMVDVLSEVIAETGVRSDIEPEIREVSRLVIGAAVANYLAPLSDTSETALADRGLAPVATMIEHLGGDETDYLRGCELLDFPALMPEGMIVHAAGPCEDGWRVFDCWTSAAHRDLWNSHVAEAIAKVDTEGGRAIEPTIRSISIKRLLFNPELIASVAARRSRSSSSAIGRPLN